MRSRKRALARRPKQHQGADHGAGAVSLADLQHRRGNIDIFLKMLVSRSGEQQQECHHEKHAQGVEPFAGLRAHVLHDVVRRMPSRGAAQSPLRAWQATRRGCLQLVGPGERLMQDVTRDAASPRMTISATTKSAAGISVAWLSVLATDAGRRLVGRVASSTPPSCEDACGPQANGPSTVSSTAPDLRGHIYPSIRCRSRRISALRGRWYPDD